MPTAAKLVGAFCLAVVAWMASQAIKELFPENMNFGIFDYVNVVIGFLCGWIVLGPRTGRGMAAGISAGVTATLMLVLWGLAVQAGNEMVVQSFRRRFDTPFEALGGAVGYFLEYGAKMMDGKVLITLFVGGVLAGMIAEFAGQRWR